jgi:hypothetical protein
MVLSARTVPLTHTATKLCLTKLQTKQDSNDLISSQMFQLYFSCGIFSKSSFISSKDSFMLAAFVRGADRNLFPLCRSTAYKITLEESINKGHSFGLCWCSKASITEQTSLQNTRYFLKGKIL